MRALVTGGAGFIGSNIAEHLSVAGHEVVVLDNFSTGYRDNLEGLGEVSLVEGDVRDPQAVAHAVRDVEVVFHLAASVGNKRSIDDPVSDHGHPVRFTPPADHPLSHSVRNRNHAVEEP